MIDDLINSYIAVYPHMATHFKTVGHHIPHTCRRMDSITLNGQKLRSGDYVLAYYGNSDSPVTMFTDPSLRPALLDYFISHTISVTESEMITHVFAIVHWPVEHSSRDRIGKPNQIWCNSVYEISFPYVIPVEYIHNLVLVSHYQVEEETLLVCMYSVGMYLFINLLYIHLSTSN